MIRAEAINKDTVHVEIYSHDFRIVIKEREALKGAISCRDRHWNGEIWVISEPEKYLHLWYIDHALRKVMIQMELPA